MVCIANHQAGICFNDGIDPRYCFVRPNHLLQGNHIRVAGAVDTCDDILFIHTAPVAQPLAAFPCCLEALQRGLRILCGVGISSQAFNKYFFRILLDFTHQCGKRKYKDRNAEYLPIQFHVRRRHGTALRQFIGKGKQIKEKNNKLYYTQVQQGDYPKALLLSCSSLNFPILLHQDQDIQ